MAARIPVTPRSGRPLGIGGFPSCVAHRGARAFAPENTLAAFRRAAEMGCAAIEIDVHLSRDGIVVVHHDDTLARCTDAARRFPCREFVSDLDLAELQTLDAGRWYARELALPAAQRQPFLCGLGDAEAARWVGAFEAVTVPTLRETLELAQALDLVVNIEIKTIPRLYDGIARAVVDQVAGLGAERSVLVSSFDHEQLLAVRRLNAVIATGVLSSDRLARPADYLRLLDADAWHPGCSGAADSLGFHSASGRLDARGIGAVRAAGGLVFVWTCNEVPQMRELAAAGVSGIITDYPNRFADAFAAAGG